MNKSLKFMVSLMLIWGTMFVLQFCSETDDTSTDNPNVPQRFTTTPYLPTHTIPSGTTAVITTTTGSETSTTTTTTTTTTTAPDTTAPEVSNVNPAEGATGVAVGLSQIVFTFNEAMNTGFGSAVFSGGAGSIDTGTWSQTTVANDTLTFTVTGPLSSTTSYSLQLNGYRDTSGNVFNGTPVLGDGILNFTTGAPDTTAPQVSTSTPTEGATGVAVGLAQIQIVFDESMNTGVGSATFSGGTGSIEAGAWSQTTVANDTLTFNVTGPLDATTSYTLNLTTYEDVAGNTLDTTTLGGDGILDFETGDSDTTAPQVSSSTPVEGATGVGTGLSQIEIVFNESMNIAAGTPTFSGGSGSIDAGAWSQTTVANDTLTFNVTGPLDTSTAYELNLTTYEDVAGNTLDTTTLGGNGILDFTTGAGDTTAPQVSSSSPAEGTSGVSIGLTQIQIVFDESMNTGVGSATFSGGSGSIDSGTWSQTTVANDTLTFTVTGPLDADTSYTLNLTTYEDVAGNSLDTSTLGDGILDFTTAAYASITIDGTLDADFTSWAPGGTIDGTSDSLWANNELLNFYVAWDDTNLYMAVNGTMDTGSTNKISVFMDADDGSTCTDLSGVGWTPLFTASGWECDNIWAMHNNGGSPYSSFYNVTADAIGSEIDNSAGTLSFSHNGTNEVFEVEIPWTDIWSSFPANADIDFVMTLHADNDDGADAIPDPSTALTYDSTADTLDNVFTVTIDSDGDSVPDANW